MLIGVLPIAVGFAPIPPDDRRIVYVGRFDRHDPQVASCQWPASEVRLRVQGPTLSFSAEEKGGDYWQIVVDGTPREALLLEEGIKSYSVNLGVDAIHDVRLVKRTEAFVGTTGFRSFDVGAGKLLAAKPLSRHIEVIGDSISCGFGNEGANQNEKFRPATENAYMSYASIAARRLKADVAIIAWSGRTMWPTNTVPEIYDLILPTVPTSLYDFRGPVPDVIVINLATNDFGRGNPDETKWTGAYEAFVRKLWARYPKAHIYAAIGSMMNDNYPAGNRSLSTLRGYLTGLVDRVHDRRLHLIEFDPQQMEDGIGSDWHPNLTTHEKMAARLAEAIKRELRW